MPEENQSTEVSRWKKIRLSLNYLFVGGSYFEEDKFPPQVPTWKWGALSLAYILAGTSFVVVIDQLFFQPSGIFAFLPSSEFWAYNGLGLVLVVLILDRYFRRKIRVHKARLEDIGEVEALIVSARNVEPRLRKPCQKPVEYKEKKKNLLAEASRLTGLGRSAWTEYQVLPLDQMYVDFIKLDDLKAEAQSSLSELEEYAGDSAYRYNRELYYKWDERIKRAINKVDNVSINDPDKMPLRRDEVAEELRAELRTLLEHVANYKKNWAKGSALIRDLTICGAAAVPIFLVMGLLPAFHPSGNDNLGILNWGLLSISGSVTSVLLYLFKTDRVEVGDTEGKNEVWRAVLSAPLGLVAGVIMFSIIKSGLLSGDAVPEIPDPELTETVSVFSKQVILSVVWAVGAGMFFEGVFERLRATIETAS